MKKNKLTAVFLLCTFALSACASRSGNISATYVSPLQYQHYSCAQVGQEMGRVSRKVMEISGKQDSAATKDAVAMTVGLVVFWPALFFLIGGDKKEELSRLKGEYEALESVAIEKECTDILLEIEKAKKRQEDSEKTKKEEKNQADDAEPGA